MQSEYIHIRNLMLFFSFETYLFCIIVTSHSEILLVLEWTPKYQTSNTPNIECPNIELSKHHIWAQNWTSNMSNITKNWTVREHQTVRSKTICNWRYTGCRPGAFAPNSKKIQRKILIIPLSIFFPTQTPATKCV